MDDNAAAGRYNGGGVVVECSVEVFPDGHVGSEGGLAEEVESEFDLWEKLVPEVSGEGGVDDIKDGY